MHSSLRTVRGKPFRPGWEFKDGKLYAFSRNDVVVLRGWPAPAAWRRTRCRPWRHTRAHANDTFSCVLGYAGFEIGFFRD